MKKSKWAKVTSIVIVIYGVFLLLQAFWPGWDIVQEACVLDIAKIVGGIILLVWGIIFFRGR